MAMLVLLLRAAEGDVLIGALAVHRLACLGVTSLAVLCDGRTICIVLDGWAFDAASSTSDVVSAISAVRRSVQMLQPSMQIAVEALPGTNQAETACAPGADGGES
jgi:hypothetical protein